MPLPEGGNIPWPPPHCQTINAQIATWAAWYSADVEQLAAIYGGSGTPGTAKSDFFASEKGGMRGVASRAAQSVRRWFWGNANRSGQPRNRLHVPIAGDISSASADLLFGEPPAVTVADKATQDRIDELIDDGAHATWLEGAEIASGLSGDYMRVCWDPGTRPDGPFLANVHPDAAVPEWSFNRLAAVTFWRIISDRDRRVVRHLERHEPGKVLHGVYEGDRDTLGWPRPYEDYPETEWLADLDLVNGNEIITSYEGLTAVYVPNMRPNRIWRGVPEAAALGRSDYAGVESLMDALDMTYSSWMRDVELGKARLVVPSEYLRSNGPGQGASFELDQEIYEGVHGVFGADENGLEIKEIQFKIRVDEHKQTITDLKATIVSEAGYSPETFGLDGEGGAMTATEVSARRARSLATRAKKIRYWRPELQQIIEALLAVDKNLFGSAVVVQRPQIEWPDAVAPDPEAEARTLLALDQAAAISTEEKVRRLHPDWEEDEITAEVERIHTEKGIGHLVDDPTVFDDGGGVGQPAPGPVVDEEQPSDEAA